ncbi:hypothetical protein GCM10027568_08150 [Humibacter soli]
MFDLDDVVRHFLPEHVSGIEAATAPELNPREGFRILASVIDEVATVPQCRGGQNRSVSAAISSNFFLISGNVAVPSR